MASPSDTVLVAAASPSIGRLRWALVADGAGHAGFLVALTLVITNLHGISAAGSVIGAMTFASISGPLLMTSKLGTLVVARAGTVNLAAAAGRVAAIGVLVAGGPLWLVALCGSAVALRSALRIGVLHTVPDGQMVRVEPWCMIGYAAGAFGGPVALRVGDDAVTVAIAVILAFVGAAGLAMIDPQSPPADRWAGSARTALPYVGYGIVMAGLSYGTLSLYPALVERSVGAAWVAPSALGYAAGALYAPRLARRLPWAAEHPSGWMLCAAAATGAWLAAPIGGPAVVVIRFVAGVTLFCAQSSIVEAARRHAPEAMPWAWIGIDVGLAGSTVLTGMLVDGLGSSGGIGVLTAAAVGVAALLAFAGRRS